MAELVWDGKYSGGLRAEPTRGPSALQTEEVHGVAPGVWHNRLVRGDESLVLPSWLGEFAGKVALAYIDPPFDTGGSFVFRAPIPGASAETPRVAVRAYDDARGLDAWLGWFFDTASVLHDLLADGGSLYVHLDSHVAHYAKVVLDEVFGFGAFQREIVWRIGWVSGFKSRARNWIRNHDVVLFYAKGGRKARSGGEDGDRQAFVFNKEYIPYPAGYVRRDGVPPRGPGYPIEDVWNGNELDRLDSIQIVSFSREKVGYPTQKNEKLVSRIVRASSNLGDLVLDCFVGSGTTAVVAEKLGRRWLACDLSPVAIHATRKRLLSAPEVSPFVVQAAGAGESGSRGTLSARVAVVGSTATVELTSFVMPKCDLPSGARAGVRHWSQWLEGWFVDWDHRGGPMCVASRQWRGSSRARLPLALRNDYRRRGRYVVLVRAVDVLGQVTTCSLEAHIAD